jgi:threonylcarbamoyladenosine tRNA methylthiotransferase MtaB
LLDGTRYENLLKQAGYHLVKDVKDAELIILNTCAFNRHKEEDTVRLIQQSKIDKTKTAQILVGGCLPAINNERLEGIHDGVTFGPRDESRLLELIGNPDIAQSETCSPISYSQYSPLKRAICRSKWVFDFFPSLKSVSAVSRILSSLFIYSKDVFCLKAETGCWGNCSYCAIRFAKGRTKSRPLDKINAEFKGALDRGFRKFVLVGDEITSYGCDISNRLNILDVIDKLLEDGRMTSLFLESFEPSFMISNLDRTLQILASKKIPVFCSSVQSGSNRILKKMNRQYRVEDFVSCIKEIRKNNPNLCLRTEIIVGFPGETKEEFEKSLELISSLNFDFVHVYEYDDMPNTVASKMPYKVSQHEKKFRRKKILRQHWKNLLKSKL